MCNTFLKEKLTKIREGVEQGEDQSSFSLSVPAGADRPFKECASLVLRELKRGRREKKG